jgi:hypothetical protein
MLSEIFILRLEVILRASNAAAPGPGHTRFVPIAPPVSPTEDVQQPEQLCRPELLQAGQNRR